MMHSFLVIMLNLAFIASCDMIIIGKASYIIVLLLLKFGYLV